MAENRANSTLAERLRTVVAGLRADLEVSRHAFRGEPSYVVRHPITFQSHHFSAADYQVLMALDDEKPLGEVFDGLVASGALSRQQEEGFYGFILSLHQMGFLNLPITDGKALYARFRRRRDGERKAKLTGFLFWRVPLVNPDAMLDRTMRYAAPLFSRAAVFLWLILMVVCGGILWQRWGDFVQPLQTILAAKNLAGMWVLLIGLKVVHEFGHAYVCKMYGGKVPEMGAYFICFTPCAYVDASASWGFPSRRQRIAVCLAGMYVESIVAAAALLVWNATEPSLLNSFAHQTVTLASIVTIGFNINPLMRYDGYYILSDLVEIPNLRQRSTTQVQAVVKWLFLGIRGTALPYSLPARGLLLVYGVCASFWKVSLSLAICAGIALKIHILGLAMAVVYGGMLLWGTISKLTRYLFVASETAPVRIRSVALGVLLLVGVPLGVALIPVRAPVKTPGVVAAEIERPVHVAASGFLQHSELVPGRSVDAETVLCVLDNPRTRAIAARARAELDVIRRKAECQSDDDPTAAAMAIQQADHLRQTLRQAQRDVANLNVRATSSGTIVQCAAVPKMGRYFQEGERIATIAAGDWIVRSLVSAKDLADTRPRVGQKVRVRLLGQTDLDLHGTIATVAEAGSDRIEEPALTQIGGGRIVVMSDTMIAGEPYFEITIRFDDPPIDVLRRGTTALVSFAPRSETLATRLHRSALRFLNKLRT